MKVKPFGIKRVEVYLGHSVGRVYRWRSRCGFCPAPGYLYSMTWTDARDSVIEHIDRHRESVEVASVLPLNPDYIVPSGPAVSTWAEVVAAVWDKALSNPGHLAMLPDEDEAQQFRNLPAV